VVEAPIVPGEPISWLLFTAMNAPLTPTALNVEIVTLSNKAALSKVEKGPAGETPNTIFA
jgi:hypothetical protein